MLSTYCFAHLAALSFEIVFERKLSLTTRLQRLISLAHQTTKLPFSLAQEQNLLALRNRTWVFSCPAKVMPQVQNAKISPFHL